MSRTSVVRNAIRRAALGLAGLVAVLAAHPAPAVPYGPLATENTINPEVMRIDEMRYLGEPLNRAYEMKDAEGQSFRLGEMMGKPLILVFSYYGCDGACPTLNESVRQSLSEVKRFQAGRDYRVLTVSFDKQDTGETLAKFTDRLTLPEAMREGWRHAILTRPETDVDTLTGSVGYKYFWSRADQVFLHPNAIIFLTPEGRVARYLYGTAIAGREIELALIDADWGRISKGNSAELFDYLTGVCFSFNYAEGRYTLNIPIFAGLASLALGVALVAFATLIHRINRSRRPSHV